MKHLKTLKLVAILFVFAFTFTSCNSDEDEDKKNEFDGSIESVRGFFGDDIVDTLEDLGFLLHTGDNPPTISGSYLASPFILQASTVSSDFVGQSFSDYLINFFNQDKGDLTIDFTSQNGGQSSEGYGSFVSGDGDKFSVYLKANSNYQGETAKFAYAISGNITSTGIKDFQFANVMLDDNGDPAGIWMENNTGRLLEDSDGFSPKQ